MEKSIPFTAAEISHTWTSYMNSSANICVFSYFIEKVEDDELRPVIQDTLDMVKRHLTQTKELLEKANYPIPLAFTDKDVNTTAPKLFTDGYMVQHVIQLCMLGMGASTVGLSNAAREDVHSYFTTAYRDYHKIHHNAVKIALEKGIYERPPFIPVPDKIDFVKKQNFLKGWFGERRPLLAEEISHLFSNTHQNIIGKHALMGFSQVAKAKEVRDYLLRGVDLAQKHINVLSENLEGNDIRMPQGSDMMVTDANNVSPFSDKLIMYYPTGMITLGIGFYGLSVSLTTRKDIASDYIRLSGEVLLYSEDGTNIMIENGWLEEPPRMVDREELAKMKKGNG